MVNGDSVTGGVIHYRFGAVWVHSCPMQDWIQTLFPGGLALTCRVDFKRPGALQFATALGYETSLNPVEQWRCIYENNIFHSVLADCFGLPFSPALWKRAHAMLQRPMPENAPSDEQCNAEIALVHSLQTYFNRRNRPTPEVEQVAEIARVPVGKLRKEFDRRLRSARLSASHG